MTDTPDIKALSEAATPGPWFTTELPWFHDGGTGIVAGDPDGNICAPVADCDPFGASTEYHHQGSTFSIGDRYDARADAALIVAAVNGLRDGTLVPASEVEAAVKKAVLAERHACAGIAAEWEETYEKHDHGIRAEAVGLVFRDIRARAQEDTP